LISWPIKGTAFDGTVGDALAYNAQLVPQSAGEANISFRIAIVAVRRTG